MTVMKGISNEIPEDRELRPFRFQGQGILVIDDLTDTGKTACVGHKMIPEAHFTTAYA